MSCLPQPRPLVCRSLTACAPGGGTLPATARGADDAAGLGDGGEVVSSNAGGLDPLFPHKNQQGDQEKGLEEWVGWERDGWEEEEEEGGALSASGARWEGEGGADAAVFGSDFDGVETEEEREGGVAAAAAGEESAAAKDPSEMRLSRRIARSGIASRREAER